MFVLIDDLRDINRFIDTGIPADETLTIRTYQEAIKFVKYTNLSDVSLMMDNDLDDPTPGHEGYDVLKLAVDSNNLPKEVLIVTANPIAGRRMRDLLESRNYTSKGYNFYSRG